jgi:hypothetical protein
LSAFPKKADPIAIDAFTRLDLNTPEYIFEHISALNIKKSFSIEALGLGGGQHHEQFSIEASPQLYGTVSDRPEVFLHLRRSADDCRSCPRSKRQDATFRSGNNISIRR